jgi:hypothetical protein
VSGLEATRERFPWLAATKRRVDRVSQHHLEVLEDFRRP